MNIPKQHHFVPESYLSGFTFAESWNGELWVIDQIKAEIRPSTPHKEAHQRHLYKVEVLNGGNEFGVERALSDFESLSIPVLKDIGKTKCIPTGEKYNLLINFIALQIVRTPKFRKNTEKIYSNIYNQLGKTTLKLLTQSKEYFDSYLDDLMARKPHLDRDKFDYAMIKEYIDKIEIEADIDRNYHVQHSLNSMDNILPLLGDRNWCVATPENQHSYFITSDNPIALTWFESKNYEKPIGFGLKGTTVIFAINKSVVILGRFELPCNNLIFNEKKVAQINTCIANASDRFLYSCEKSVNWLKPNDEIGNIDQMIKYIKSNTAKGKLKNS